MELIKNNIKINRTIKQGVIQKGADTDIIVPDILPDISRILQVDGKATIINTELTDGNLTIEGKVNLNILYSPESENEKIQSIDTATDFSMSLDNNEISSGMQSNIFADVEKLDFQILNSRKLRIKTTVAITYEILEQASLGLTSGVEDENARVCISPLELTSLIDMKESEFSIREDFELPPGHTAIKTLLKTDAVISDTEQKIVSGRLVVRGSLNLSCLYIDSSGALKSADFEKPFTEIFDVEDADDDTLCETKFTVKDLSCHTEADSDGDMRILMVNAEAKIYIVATKKVNTDILVDVFLPGTPTSMKTRETEIETTVSANSHQSTIREIILPPEGCPPLSGIYNIYTTPIIKKTEILTDKVSVSGYITCCILYLSDSPESPVFSQNKDIPFCLNIETPGSEPGMECVADISVIHTSYNLNPASESEVRCIINSKVTVSARKQLCIIEEITENHSENLPKKGIVLYFVQKHDTLWSIAKHYSISPDDILSANNLPEDFILHEGKPLLIPVA